MKLKEAARGALAAFPTTAIDGGLALLEELPDGSFTARFDDGSGVTTVILELSDETARLACTCGVSDCVHQAALLAALAGDEVFPARTSAPPSTTPTDEASVVEARTTSFSVAELTAAVDGLVGAICKLGLSEESEERDLALARVIELLAGQDLPDLKRTVATVRRTLTTVPPSPSTALPALARLLRISADLASESQPQRTLAMKTERREEVKLLEIARYSRRTPFGDRRDVLYFLDLDEDVLYRELSASKPGGSAAAFSEGPFGKRLLGNLVSIEEGPVPRRIRMLQYATVGFADEGDFDHVLDCCQTEVEALYAVLREAVELGLDAAEKVVMFSPERVLPSRSGIVLCDDSDALLPLARGRNPAICAATDLLDRQGTILAIIGQLVLEHRLLTILPLTALVDLEGGRSLRRLT